MFRIYRTTLAVALMGLIAAPGVAGAGLITYEFTGDVSNVANPFGQLPSDIVAGSSTFSGSFTIDDSAPDGDADPQLGSYGAGQTGEFQVLIDSSYQFGQALGPSGTILVVHDGTGTAGRDEFSLVDSVDPTASSSHPSLYSFSINLRLFDDTNTDAITGDSLAGLSLDLSKFDVGSRSFSLYGNNDGSTTTGFIVEGQLTSLQKVSAVPEPTSLALFGVGMMGVCAGIRRRNRKTN